VAIVYIIAQGKPLAGWPSYWLRPPCGAFLLQCLRWWEIPSCPFI